MGGGSELKHVLLHTFNYMSCISIDQSSPAAEHPVALLLGE